MPLLVAIDTSVLGTAFLYNKHQTGVHRALSELLRRLRDREDLRLEFVSAGRAPWLEFVNHIAFDRDWRREGWVFRSRRTRLPGLYPLLMALSRLGLYAKDRKWISEAVLAGLFQTMGRFLDPALAAFSAKVYYSPAHALPKLPDDVKRCITLYDMIPVKFPQWYDESESFRKILRSIDVEKDHVAAISDCSRRDWIEHSGMRADLTQVIPCGVAEDFFPRRDQAGLQGIREKYGMGASRFVLAVGTLEPRKNLETLVRAFMELREADARQGRVYQDVLLLLIGPKGWKNDSLFRLLKEKPQAAEAVRLAGFVPDADLPWLYSACEVFVFPSLYEGYGLPVAEALKCGAAVVCGGNSSLPEVAGEAARYVDVTQPEAIRSALAELLFDDVIREALKAGAVLRGESFDWAGVADAYFRLFSSLAVSAAD